MRKILFFVADTAGCAHYRVMIPIFGLMKTGKYDCKPSMIITPDKFDWKPEVVVFSRQHKPEVRKEIEEFKRRGCYTVYDTDDNLINIYPSNPVYKKMRTVEKDLIETIRVCDLVTVSTQPLYQVYSKYHNNVRVLPNQIIKSYGGLSIANNTDTIRIGWAGTNTHVSDFSGVAHAIIDISKRHDRVKFVFMGFIPKIITESIPPEKIEYHEGVSIDKYYVKLASLRLDIGLAPLHDNEFNRGKSNLKILEYGMLGIPTIASEVYPYQKTIEDGVDGFLIKRDKYKFWMRALERLIINPEERKIMGGKIKEKVLNNYSIENNVHLWEEAYFGGRT